MKIIALDAHKRYSQVCVQKKDGRFLCEKKINHSNYKRFPFRHTSRLYKRIRERKGRAKAVGAVGRHLAEASFWILTRNEDYKEPEVKSVSPTTV